MPDNRNFKKILIVEDDETLNTALKTRLTAEGFDVRSAYNGQEGLEIAGSYRPNLILLDIIMPVMNGYEMYNKLMETPYGSAIAVQFLSNVTDSAGWLNVLGGTSYLVKSSWSLSDVVTKVKERLSITDTPISSAGQEVRMS